MIALTAYCAACMCQQPFDANWRALWIDADGDLRIMRAARSYSRDGAVLVCGEGTALALTERYLHGGNFDAAHDLHLALQHDAHNHFATL